MTNEQLKTMATNKLCNILGKYLEVKHVEEYKDKYPRSKVATIYSITYLDDGTLKRTALNLHSNQHLRPVK